MTPEQLIIETHDAMALKPSLAKILEQLRQARIDRDAARAELANVTQLYRHQCDRSARLHAQLQMLASWHRRPQKRNGVNSDQIMLPLEGLS